MFLARYAILIDGGFLTKKIYQRVRRHATADDIVAECERISQLDIVKSYELLRIYYYDAYPSNESVKHPVTGNRYDLATTERFRAAQSLYDQLILKPNVALRMGETRLAPNVWKVKPHSARDILRPRVR